MSLFAKRFKQLRESRGWTQDDIADKLGISRPTVAGYESENKKRIPREETLHKIADLFGTSVDYLLGRDNIHFSKEFQEFDELDFALENALEKATPEQKQKALDFLEGKIDNLMGDLPASQVAIFTEFLEDLERLSVVDLMKKYGFSKNGELLTEQEARSNISSLMKPSNDQRAD